MDMLTNIMSQYSKLANHFSNPPENHESIADQILHKGDFEHNDASVISDVRSWIRGVEDEGYASGSGATAVVQGVEAYRSLAGQFGLKDTCLTSHSCQVAADAQARKSMEHDFTTSGVRGNLRCPFAKSDRNQPVVEVEDGKPELCGNENLDPIRAEFHSRGQSTTSVSGQSGAAARCPIRYLDNHSPEALAEYFEKHKHEVPRSHAICIQRYQTNSQSLRELDEKYGDLVTMVKGLGKYHQPYLPSNQDVSEGRDPASVERVEKWAEDVSIKSPGTCEAQALTEGEKDIGGDDDRDNHFDRPLRDVRLGESPSRPWGIHVPVPDPEVDNTVPSPAIPVSAGPSQNDWSGKKESPIRAPPASKGLPAAANRCPFQIPGALRSNKDSNTIEKLATPKAESLPTKEKGGSPHIQSAHTAITPPAPDPSRVENQPCVQPKMIFNGPVFFGYSPEATAVFLEKLGNS